MKPVLHLAATSLLLSALAGCHRGATVVAAAPPPPPPTTPAVSVPPPTHVPEPLPDEPVIASEPLDADVPLVPRRVFRVHPVNTVPPPLTAPARAVDLGELTTGGSGNSGAARRGTDDLLRSQQRRLASVPSEKVARHSQQVEQAKLYLLQAGDAYSKQDLEGAKTLATKARVLLDEVFE